VLKEPDYTVCSIRSRFGLGREAQTERTLHAMARKIQLVLRERTVALVQNYVTSRATVEKYQSRTIPRAQKATTLI